MKTYLLPSLKLSLVLLLLCSVFYPLIVAGFDILAPGGGDGQKLTYNGRIVGYENTGHAFTQPEYFQGPQVQ